jgi:Capsular polysaccharide synthesis protein
MQIRRAISRLVPTRAKTAIHLAVAKVKWLCFRFPKDPAVEIYSLRKDTENRAFHALVTRQKAEGHEAWLEPWHVRFIPKTVWIFWSQGETSFPPVVKACVDEWRRLNANWTIRVLDKTLAEELIDMSDVPDSFPLRIYADALRVRLLARYGGVWADSTVFPHKALDAWLPLLGRSGFFVFTDDGPGRELESWFIASEAGHPLATGWDRSFSRHLARTTTPHEAYFHIYYVLQHQITVDRDLKAAWAVMPRLPAPPCFFLRSHLEGTTPEDIVRNALAAGLPLSKLDWRLPRPIDDVIGTITRLSS